MELLANKHADIYNGYTIHIYPNGDAKIQVNKVGLSLAAQQIYTELR